MVGVGKIIEIQGELFEIVRVLKVAMGKILPLEHTDVIKEAWHAERVFRNNNEYYFVNTVQTIEPIQDEN